MKLCSDYFINVNLAKDKTVNGFIAISYQHYTDLLPNSYFNMDLLLSRSQRLVPDTGVRLHCSAPAGRQGEVQRSLYTAVDCTRPFKIPHYSQLPTILRVEMIWTAQ